MKVAESWDSEEGVELSRHIMRSCFAKCVAFENWMMRRTLVLALLNLLIAHQELSTRLCLLFAV